MDNFVDIVYVLWVIVIVIVFVRRFITLNEGFVQWLHDVCGSTPKEKESTSTTDTTDVCDSFNLTLEQSRKLQQEWWEQRFEEAVGATELRKNLDTARANFEYEEAQPSRTRKIDHGSYVPVSEQRFTNEAIKENREKQIKKARKNYELIQAEYNTAMYLPQELKHDKYEFILPYADASLPEGAYLEGFDTISYLKRDLIVKEKPKEKITLNITIE